MAVIDALDMALWSGRIQQSDFDAIQEEVDRRFVARPVDHYGEVIRVGDIVSPVADGGTGGSMVCSVDLSCGRGGEIWRIALDDPNQRWHLPSEVRHYFEPTLEEVLREFAQKVIHRPTYEEVIAEYCDRLRLAGDKDEGRSGQ